MILDFARLILDFIFLKQRFGKLFLDFVKAGIYADSTDRNRVLRMQAIQNLQSYFGRKFFAYLSEYLYNDYRKQKDKQQFQNPRHFIPLIWKILSKYQYEITMYEIYSKADSSYVVKHSFGGGFALQKIFKF